MTTTPLPFLPFTAWASTKTTLHLYLQIVGKVRLALMPPRNHWWHVPLYVTARGLTTRPIPWNGGAFEVRFDFWDHALRLETSAREQREMALDGLPVADFYRRFMDVLGEVGIQASVDPRPYDLPFDTPFPEDRDHDAWDRESVERFWRILVFTDGVLSRFAGRFVGKTSPVHLFWHSFDLALTRFSGRSAPLAEGNAVAREAYSHEAVSFGFWAGDDNLPEPAYYSYTYPEPEGLREQPLEPAGARWTERGTGSLAVYPYEDVRTSRNPEESLLTFLESAYRAGAERAGWDVDALRHPRYG